MKAHIPRVSIGIPVYNGEKYIEETIKSMLAQTATDFELIISDNASTDRTEGICRDYASNDLRIRYYRNEENIGGSMNFTRVFELSRSSYFKWAAHDDLCAPTFLEKCMEILDANPTVVLCYPRIGFIDLNGVVIGDHDAGCNLRSPLPSERVRQLFLSMKLNCLPMFGLIRQNVLKKTSLIAPYISSDQILLLQLALRGEIYEIPEQLFFFREHPDRSIWRYKTFAEYAKWHNPNRYSIIQLPRWRLAFEFIRSIGAADIGFHEARKCYIWVIKRWYWYRSVLMRDVVMMLKQCAAHVFGLEPIADMKSARVVQNAPGFNDDKLTNRPSHVSSTDKMPDRP